MNIIFTVCNRATLANAIALRESVRKHQPDAKFCIGWVDDIPCPDLKSEVSDFIPVENLNIPAWGTMLVEYFDFELLPATRPWFAGYILDHHPACNRLIFLAPSVLLFGSIQSLLDMQSDFIVTANIHDPILPQKGIGDKNILNVGMFHAGAWIVRRSEQTASFLHWWCVRTIDRAKFRLCEGMCVDQLWLNFVPVRIEGWQKAMSKGWHVGLARLTNDKLIKTENGYSVGGAPLLSVDFAGTTFYDPIWSDYIGLAKGDPVFKQLLAQYKSDIAKIGPEYLQRGNPGYGKISVVSPNRLLRNGLANKIRKVTAFIDNY